MAESPSPPSHTPPPPPPTPPSVGDPPTEYWCYQCDKRVPIETLPDQPDVICFECKNGFVELISAVHHHHNLLQPTDDDDDDQPNFGHEFLQVLRLIAQSARDNDAPPLPPSDDRENDIDHLRIELDALSDNDDENNNNEDDEEDEEDNEEDINNDEDDRSDDEDERRRQRRDVIRLRLRDFATRALTRGNGGLDLAEILMGLEDHSIEFRFQIGENDRYIGNPGDYVDAAGYEALLQTLAESDNGSKRGSPPAAKSAVEGLPTVEVIVNDSEVCAICKDKVFNNEKEVVKQLPCGHMYHQDCIVPWLGSRNTCPICRFELPTDDPEYEEDRKKRLNDLTANASSTSGGGGGD
ncbi:E3 ubiquitin-protein ligase CIP8 [Rutidosis leptorrhynchoides]|uniref:E3 ubiquitin-protein ligase CIP8 n=1 Tax=Rutidosis leptorrhynchoides TaxID=125765 RepID=UPI003A997DC9